MAPPLGHDEFFNSLSSILSTTSQKARGSIYLTQKPLPAPATISQAEDSIPQRPSILIRVTDGNTSAPNPKSETATTSADAKAAAKSKSKSTKVKISTVVTQDELEAFYARYAEVCKSGMTGLKKRDRKRGKAKGKAAAAGKVVRA